MPFIGKIHHSSFIIYKKRSGKKIRTFEKELYEVKCKSVIKNYIELPTEPEILMQTDQWYKVAPEF